MNSPNIPSDNDLLDLMTKLEKKRPKQESILFPVKDLGIVLYYLSSELFEPMEN